jgi:hypothetical protein
VAGGGAIPGSQRGGDTLDRPTAFADEFEGADEVADLVVEEAAGFRDDFNDVVVPGDVQAVQCAHG